MNRFFLPSFVRSFVAIAAVAIIGSGHRAPDDLDAFIETQMARREIVGLSLAIIDDGKIVETRAYGTTTRGGSQRVTPGTLFQAGSVSKPVAALGALRLVEKGKLSLDEDVNVKLKSWKVPDNEFTTTEKVTLRRLLSHSAGLTVHGFPGYAVSARVPTVPEVLDGKGNTAPVRVNVIPGTIWRYSGGGYTVMQQLVSDLTGKNFDDYMRDEVLRPLGMTSSTYQQPLPANLAAKTASGYYPSRGAVEGKWHVYPEMAAAGLWTTATDLARYAIGVQEALAGRSKVLSPEMTRQMLTVQKGSYGLGPALADSARTLRFSHGGRDEGFDTFLEAYAETGDGIVIMINANDNSRAMRRIINFIARKYDWPNYPMPAPMAITEVETTPAALAEVTGRYEFQNNNMMTLIAQRGRIFTDVTGLPDEEFVPIGEGRFASTERPVQIKVLRNEQGQVRGIDWTAPNVARAIARVGPLFPPTESTDPQPDLTDSLMVVLRQFAQGGAAVKESKLVTEGVRKNFQGANPDARDVKALAFVHAENVSGRGIERHGHAIAKVLHYRVKTSTGDKLLLVHVDANGLVGDYDFVLR